MRTRSLFIPVLAALFLAACNDQSAEAPNEYDVGPTEEAAPVEQPAVEEPAVEEASEPIVITVPSVEVVQETVTHAAEQTAEQISQAAEQLTEAASERLNDLTDGQPVGEAAQDAVQGVASAISDQLDALVPDQPVDVDWQTSFSPDIPYYNLSEEPVMAYDAPEGTMVVATIGQGEGGFIETCNAALDWCEISLGDGSTAWVDMEPFGGVAN